VNTSGVPIVGNLTVTGTLNSCTGPVRTFRITINPEPVVAAVANQSYCPGDAASITLTSNVVGSTISWTNSNPSIGIGASGSGDIIFTAPNNLTGANIVGTIVVTSSSNGCTSAGANSKTFTITIKPSPVVAAVTDIVVCNGASVGPLALSANTFPATTESFSWSGGASVGLVNGSDATAPYEIPSFVAANGGTTPVTVIINVTSTLNGCTGPIRTFNITVNPTPALTVTDNTTGTICSDSQTDISVTDLVVGSSIKLVGIIISGAPGNITGHSPVNSTFASGSRITDLLVNTTTSDQTIQYDFQSTANGCTGSIQSVVVTVRPRAIFSYTNVPSTICEGPGDQTNIVLSSSTVGMRVRISNVTATGGVTGFSPIGTQFNSFPSSIINTLDNPTNQPQTVTYELEGSLAGVCVNPTITNVTVTINPRPEGVNDSKTVCSDVAIDYNLLINVATMGNNVSSTFSWIATDNVNPLVTGESTTPMSGPIITDVITNLTNTNQDVVYTVTPTGTNGCAGANFQITITVKPEPVGVSTSAPDICSGSIVGYNLQTNVNTLGNNLASNFTWTATPQPNVTGETTSLKSGNIIDDVLVNTTTTNQVVVYTVTPTGQVGGCLGNPFTISVNVNPKAIFTAGPNLSVCVDQNDIEIQGTVTFSPAPFYWTPAGAFDNNLLEKPKYILTAADKAVTVPTTRVLTLNIPAAGACPAESKTMTLTINPLPGVVFFNLPPTIAENAPPIVLKSNQASGPSSTGLFTITPGSGLSSTTTNVVDEATFDPSAATLGPNTVRYTYTNENGCTNFYQANVIVNPVTTATISIANSTFDPLTSTFKLCADQGPVALTGSPSFASGGPATQFIASVGQLYGGTMTIIQSGSSHTIQTNGLVSDTYIIDYRYENGVGAISDNYYAVEVLASPVAAFTSSGSCVDGPVSFADGSTINPTPFPTSISNLRWDFDDLNILSGPPGNPVPLGTHNGQSTGTYSNPSHKYLNASTYNVTLTTTTAQGCSNTAMAASPIILGATPAVSFIYAAICNNDSTRFVANVTNLGTSVVAEYEWKFGDADILTGNGPVPNPTHSGRTTGTHEKPLHKYVSTGLKTVELTVKTDLNCASFPAIRTLNIAPYVTLTQNPSTAPFDFENGRQGWFIEDITVLDDTTNVSWDWGAPAGATINTSVNGSYAWRTQKNANTYFTNETSVVNSPCFNLTLLDRPMISLDYWSDMESNVDGAVIQYSVNGGLDWAIVGPPVGQVNRDEGINWFNGVTIPSNPGLQPLGSYGWTGKQGGWKNARFNLDMIPIVERDQIRLRIAFASNDLNPTGNTFDGFAFDNVFVGNKQRNVLVEHFTNTNLTASTDGDVYLDGLLNSQITAKGVSDFSDLRYHISFPTPDPFNNDNPTDPGARASYYNVSQSPATIMDGKLDGVKFKGRYLDITNVEIDRRALVDPLFDLVLDTIPTGNNNTISVRLNITARQNFTSPLIAQVALIEKSAAGSKNIVRKQLFGADGTTISTPWTQGQILNQLKNDVIINVPIVNSNQLALVGYIQDKNTKEIYQSVRIDAPFKRGSVVVGLEDEPLDPIANQITMYPNPANGEVNFGLPSNNMDGYNWRIADQRGVIMLQGNFERSFDDVYPVDVSQLPNGIYHVIISGKNNSATYRKLVIMNRN